MINHQTIFLSDLLHQELYSKWVMSLLDNFSEHKIQYHFLEGTKDLWIRDVLPIQVAPNQFVQFSLTRDYYYKKDRHKQTDPAPICKTLGIEPYIPLYNNKPIYLDGGNVILNPSKTKAIITEKVFNDNEIPQDLLSRILQEVLQVERVVFIPVEPNDDTGHSDGMVRFIDDRKVVANDYSKVEYADRGFKDRFYGALAGSGLDVLLVPYNPVNLIVNGLFAALGCYINFLKVGDKVFLPTFDNQAEDDEASERFREIFGAGNIIPVRSSELAIGGGVLNCASWEIQ